MTEAEYKSETKPIALIDIQLSIPENDRSSDCPEISIVVPSLNEEITIGEFVAWCWLGLEKAGVKGELIIVDSSTDETPNIALQNGARVLRTPRRGLGQAYIDAIPHIRGKFIVMGDCDLTYDFRDVKVFVDSYHSGNEFVMGSRFLGSIEDGAMPKLHRYFGTPLTTWLLNKIYRTKYSDIHCGMRGITKLGLQKIQLTSSGWEYASEMVLKAARVRLNISEVPVKFYKDRDGRESHLKRGGFMTPWIAGWINLKVMLVYSPDSFLLKPGGVFFLLGIVISIMSLIGPASVGPVGFGIYTAMVASTLSVLGYALIQAGILARFRHKLRSGVEGLVINMLTYNRGMFVSFLLFMTGFLLDLFFMNNYLENSFHVVSLSKSAIFGLLLIILGIQTFSFTLLLDLERRMLKIA